MFRFSVFSYPAMLLGLAVIAASGCYAARGSGQVIVETFDVEGFTSISMGGAGRLIIAKGDFNVTVSAEDNVMPSVVVEKRGRNLELGRTVDWLDGVRPTIPIEFRVTMPEIAGIDLAGSGRASMHDFAIGDQPFAAKVSGSGSVELSSLQGAAVNLTVSGSGDISANNIEVRAASITISGAGRISLAGSGEAQSVAVAGSGYINAAEFETRSTKVNISGAGQALVWAEEELTADIAGSGRVTYRGNPQRVVSDVAGSGRVIHKADL